MFFIKMFLFALKKVSCCCCFLRSPTLLHQLVESRLHSGEWVREMHKHLLSFHKELVCKEIYSHLLCFQNAVRHCLRLYNSACCISATTRHCKVFKHSLLLQWEKQHTQEKAPGLHTSTLTYLCQTLICFHQSQRLWINMHRSIHQVVSQGSPFSPETGHLFISISAIKESANSI